MSSWCGYDPSITQSHNKFAFNSNIFSYFDDHKGDCHLGVDNAKAETITSEMKVTLPVSNYKCGADSHICFQKEGGDVKSYCVLPKDVECDSEKGKEICSETNI